MQLIPGVLLGQDFGQTLLEKNADRHMLRQGAQRMLQLPPVTQDPKPTASRSALVTA